MKIRIATALAMIALGLPAYAAGDAAKGEKEFRKCKACHMIASPDEVIVKGGKIGPNLYGVPGRALGSEEGFKYSDLFKAANEKGLTWTEENFVGYVQDPTGWLQEQTGASGRAKMTFKERKADKAADVWAYLESVSN